MPTAAKSTNDRVLGLQAQDAMPLLKKLGAAAPFDSDQIITPAFQLARKQRAA